MSDAERIAELEEIVRGLRSIVDVARRDWMREGAWTEYDEAVHARSIAYNLRKLAEPSELPSSKDGLTPDLFYDLQERAARSFRLHQAAVRGQQLVAADSPDWHLAAVTWHAARSISTGSAE